MGYYTNYSLTVLNDRGNDLTILRNELHVLHGEEIIDANGDSDEIKWYSWEEDMTALSKKYPDMLIELSGDGEESDDIWVARFKGGISEYHRMYMPSFIGLVDTSKKSQRYYYNHIEDVRQCEEFDNLSNAIANILPELIYDTERLNTLKKKLVEAALNFISDSSNSIIL